MSRLIDAEALKTKSIELVKELAMESGNADVVIGNLAIISVIDDVPTIEAEPVRHGKWIEPVPGDGFPYCSICKHEALDKGLFLNSRLMDWHRTTYCPYCGARMDAPTCGPDYCEIGGGDDES